MEVLGEASEKRSVLEAEQRKLEHSDSKNVVDLLHPLATIHWEEWIQSSLFKTPNRGQRILFKGRPYLFTEDGILMYNYDSHSLAKVKLPSKELYGISTYRSQLVLVGGLDRTTQQATNKVWVSDDGSKWEPSLPPLPIACVKPLVLNFGSPEYLIVIGGQIMEDCIHVHVLMGEKWMAAQPMPLNTSERPSRHLTTMHLNTSERPSRHLTTMHREPDFLAHTVHNRNFVISRGLTPSLHCNLDALLATVSLGSFRERQNPSRSVWRKFAVPARSYHLLSLGNCMIAAGNIDPHAPGPGISVGWCGTMRRQLRQTMNRTPTILRAYSPITQIWVQVGDIPYSYQHTLFCESSSVLHGSVLPHADYSQLSRSSLLSFERELVLVMPQEDSQQRILKASVKMSPYDPDSQFSMSALCRLENKGIPVLKSLEPLHKELAVVAKVALSGGANSEYMHSDPRNATEIIIRQWTLGEKPILPPTWRSLYQVLRELGLEDLSQEIEEFLSSTKSLKEMCMSVIMSALLQQRFPDDRLPNYVPKIIRHSILHNFKALTFQL